MHKESLNHYFIVVGETGAKLLSDKQKVTDKNVIIINCFKF